MDTKNVLRITRARLERLIKRVRPACPKDGAKKVADEVERAIDEAVQNAFAKGTKKTGK